MEAGLKTITDHYAELGADFREEIERRGADAKLILETAAKYGVPPELLWNRHEPTLCRVISSRMIDESGSFL